MSGLWLTPAAPGTVAPSHLDRVRELHAAVRDWIERSATAQRNEHLLANLPYVDLMFAFGFATLGDHPTATKLTEDARKVLEVPIPAGGNPQAELAVTAALVRNFLFKAFRYRVEQALSGKPNGGPLSAEVLADRGAIGSVGGPGPVNSPHKLAAFVIDKFREQSRILEPQEQVDPYADWTKPADAVKRHLAELHTLREPGMLAEWIRALYRDGVPDKPLVEVRFEVLRESLPLAPRVSEAFTMELLALVPASFLHPASSDSPRKQTELLGRALFLAGYFGRAEIVRTLIDDFTALVRSKPEEARYRLINAATGQCLRILKMLGLAEEVDRLLTNLYAEVLGGASSTDLRKKYAPKPDAWATVVQTLLNLVSGWTYLGLLDRTAPILAEARQELLGTHTQRFQPKDYTDLARAYVTTLGAGPAESGLLAMIDLFCKMDPLKITNTWTTAQYYSRFHMLLVEDTVFALCPSRTEEPVPAIVTA